jgi:hypothetical protein
MQQKRALLPVDAEGKRGTPLRRGGRGGDIEVHSYACSEAGSDIAVVDETDVLVESQRVRIRCDLDALDSFPRGHGHDVSQQVATDSASVSAEMIKARHAGLLLTGHGAPASV